MLKFLYTELDLANGFHIRMQNYLDEYREYLLLVKSNGTCVSHGSILNQFIDYLFDCHLISEFNQITVGMCNSKYLSYYLKQNDGTISKEELKAILNGYFTFIYGKYGIKNEKVMRALGR